MIRSVTPEDSASICDIYNYYILNSIATFEEVPVTEDTMEDRICRHPESLPWLLYEDENKILGYAYATHWHSRSAYRYSVESTVYVAHPHFNRAIGKTLYTGLIQRLKDIGIHSIVAGISLPNKASVGLHQKLGFEKVAHFKEVGWKMNQWIDVGYWELLFHGNQPD